jgi:hypothetical protein
MRLYSAEYRRTHPRAAAEQSARWKAAHPKEFKQGLRKVHLKRTYGITPEEYTALLLSQNGRCAICRADGPGRGHQNFCVDHDHQTGEVRGLLCHKCNRAIGLLGDAPETVQAAYEYLSKKRN